MLETAYCAARKRVTELVTSLSAEQLQAKVPATPDWTAHELLAHLVGGAADAAVGRVDGAPGERWTLRHHPALVVRDESGREWVCGSGEPVTHLRCDGYELLRGLYSRRSQRQVVGWDWVPGPPPRELTEHFGFFGPREDDQPVPLRDPGRCRRG